MNRARSDRTLGSMDETTHKRLKTVDKTEQGPGAEVNSVWTQTTYRVFCSGIECIVATVILIVTNLFLPRDMITSENNDFDWQITSRTVGKSRLHHQRLST